MTRNKPTLWRAKLIDRIFTLIWVLWLAAFIPGDRYVTIWLVLSGMIVALVWVVLAQIQIHKIQKELEKITAELYIDPGEDVPDI